MTIRSRIDFESQPHKRSLVHRRIIFLIVICAWLVVVVAGLKIVWNYENTPGAPAQPPATWPTASTIPRSTDRWTLVVLAHPHCPCTRASIQQLNEIMAHTSGRLRAYVLFLNPRDTDDDWSQTDLWDSASVIPGVTVLRDKQGKEALNFGAVTSGQTALYDSGGRLKFSGGITGARGHAGANAGSVAVISLVNSGQTNATHTAVFGCPLFAESECKTASENW